jgi:hypothetical protein
MGKRYFRVTFDKTVDLELDDAVISVVDTEWRTQLYDLKTPEQIAEHIAYNLLINNLKLSQQEGWADQPDSNAKIIGETLGWNAEVTEVST